MVGCASPAWLSFSASSSLSSSPSSASLSGAPNGFAAFPLWSGLPAEAPKLERGFAPDSAEPKPPPPIPLPNPLGGEDIPAKGEALPLLPNVSLGTAAADAGCDSDGDFDDAKDDRTGLEEPNALPLEAPRLANADDPAASLPNPDAANVLEGVSGDFLVGDLPACSSFCNADCASAWGGFWTSLVPLPAIRVSGPNSCTTYQCHVLGLLVAVPLLLRLEP